MSGRRQQCIFCKKEIDPDSWLIIPLSTGELVHFECWVLTQNKPVHRFKDDLSGQFMIDSPEGTARLLDVLREWLRNNVTAAELDAIEFATDKFQADNADHDIDPTWLALCNNLQFLTGALFGLALMYRSVRPGSLTYDRDRSLVLLQMGIAKQAIRVHAVKEA